MKLRSKTVLTVLFLSLMMFVSLEVITTFILQPSFSVLEDQECREQFNQANGIINYRTTDLIAKAKDYAFWNDTCLYVEGEYSGYPEDNFMESTFENLGVNLIAIADKNPDLLYCQSFDLYHFQKIDASDVTKQALTEYPTLWQFPNTLEATSGLMVIDNKTMLIAIAPVVTSEGLGPAKGGVLFGKYLDDQEITTLANLIEVNFCVTTLSDFQNNPSNNQLLTSLLSSSQPYIQEYKNPETILSYSLINDVNADPAFVLTIAQTREAYQQSILVGNVFLVAAVVFSICFGSLILIMLEREIVQPMTKLAAYVEKISLNTNYPPPPCLVHAVEEVTVLTNAVRNTMKRKFEGMNEVSTMVAHDLRNPLSGIKNAVYVLKKKYANTLGDDGQAMLNTIEDCISYSDKIVQDLFDYSSEIRPVKVPASPKKLVDVALSKFVLPLNIVVINETQDEQTLLVDHLKIERVFTNLINNALDAMHEGGTLTITSSHVKDYIQIDFADTGAGMPSEVLEKLWTPFFTTKAKGMGIGLAICKRIVDAHGGKIEVQSVEGEGTIFSVFLPSSK
ncbi:MAG: ATP-binding protein [Candidatus Bathyarchaeota archaeon]|nr:ATP-binding protein [Candidatus Bathyarchaeota archaeon]